MGRYELTDYDKQMGRVQLSLFEGGGMELTKREQEIYDLTCIKGLSPKEIMNILVVSKKTVYAHLKNIFYKKGVKNKTELLFKHWSRNE